MQAKFLKPIVLSFFFAVLLSANTFAQNLLGTAGKIWYDDSYIYVNLVNQGILVIDNHDVRNPQKIGFIAIEGNVDMAVRGNILYANSYEDLVTIDITNFKAVKELDRIKGVFSHRRSFNNTARNTVGWQSGNDLNSFLNNLAQTLSGNGLNSGNRGSGLLGGLTGGGILGGNGMGGNNMGLAQSVNPISSAGGGSGGGGSMACFTLKDNYLYAIDASDLHIFDIASPNKPYKTENTVKINSDIETIFSYEEKLFVGSQTGMYIFDIKNRAYPQREGTYKHTRSCDPVVVEGDYAYVTMRDGNLCGNAVNQLDIIDISNSMNPRKVKSYNMTNPHGLGIDKGVLFVCDGRDGLKVFDASNPNNIRQLARFANITTYDVIPNAKRKILIMVGSNQIFQYDYTDPNNPQQLSSLAVLGETKAER